MLKHLIISVQNQSVRDSQTNRQTDHPLISLWGGQQWPHFKQSLSPWRGDCLNPVKTSTPLPQQFVSTGNWDQVHSNFTVVVYQQLKTAHAVNGNILSNVPSGADGKGTTGWALGTVGLQRVWRTTLPLSNKRLKCSCTTTTRDETVWITSWSGLETCMYRRLGSDTRGSLRARKSACTPSKLKTF